MKLTSLSDLVKPDRRVLAVALASALATVLTVHIVLLLTDRAQVRMEHFGTAAAHVLAELAKEPLMRQDRMHLGVIGNRLAETREIRGVTSYSADDRVLASTGDMGGPQYTAPVTLDDSVVGYVRIAVQPAAFSRGDPGRLPALLVVGALTALAVAVAWSLAAAARRGDLAAALPRRGASTPIRNGGTAKDRPDDTEGAELRVPEAAVSHYLLAVNLYNQLTLDASEREFERALCLELAEAVAEAYHGQAVRLPGVGMLVDFHHSDDDDRPFQILCAAFVLIRLLSDEAPFGRYRLGLNLAERPAHEALPLDDAAVTDAALLSALARDGTLAISAPFSRSLGEQSRFVAMPLVNPLLDELTTSNADCRLVTGLENTFATLVVQQAERIKGQRDEISSPSTF